MDPLDSNFSALPSAAAYRDTVNDGIRFAGQTDTDPLTVHDADRCVAQGLVAAAVLSSNHATRGALQALDRPRAGTRQRQIYDSIARDYTDGSLSARSLSRLGDLLYEQHATWSTAYGERGTDILEFQRLVEEMGAVVTRPWDAHSSHPMSTLDALERGEFAMVGTRTGFGQTTHAVMVARQPGTQDQWMVYNPLRSKPLRANLQRHEVEEALRPSLAGRAIGNGDPFGVLATLRW